MSALADGENEPITVTKLSQIVGINRSTCAHIIATLVEYGYAERVSHKLGYILGPEAYCLSRFGKYEENIIAICRPIMKWLYKKTGKTVILATIKNDKKFIIEAFDYEHKMFQNDLNIRHDDIYRTATGRIILANMEREEVLSIYKKYGNPPADIWSEVTSEKTFLKELSLIGKKDIAMTKQYREDIDTFVIGYGGAIFKDLKCVGAIGVALSKKADEESDFEEEKIKNDLKRAAAEISRRLGYK